MKNFIFIILFSCFLYACPLLPDNHINENCDYPYFNFDLPVSFIPGDSLIHVGDTITIKSIIPKEMYSTGSNVLFDFDSVDFKIYNGFIRFDTLLEKKKSYAFTNDFDFIVDSIFNFYKGDNIIGLTHLYSAEDYYLEYKFIPKVKGTYLFEFVSRIGLTDDIKGKIIQAVDSDCITDEWYIHFMTNNGNNYKELLLQSLNKDYNTTVYNDWGRENNFRGAHCFKVE